MYLKNETFQNTNKLSLFGFKKLKLKCFQNYVLVVTCDKVKMDHLTSITMMIQYLADIYAEIFQDFRYRYLVHLKQITSKAIIFKSFCN